ncbi:hypothetical protein D3C83_02370 [compost metagenome]
MVFLVQQHPGQPQARNVPELVLLRVVHHPLQLGFRAGEIPGLEAGAGAPQSGERGVDRLPILAGNLAGDIAHLLVVAGTLGLIELAVERHRSCRLAVLVIAPALKCRDGERAGGNGRHYQRAVFIPPRLQLVQFFLLFVIVCHLIS